jgi:hypothetical protein
MSKIWVFFQPRDLEIDTKSVHSYDEAYGGGNTPTPQVCVDFSHVIMFLQILYQSLNLLAEKNPKSYSLDFIKKNI